MSLVPPRLQALKDQVDSLMDKAYACNTTIKGQKDEILVSACSGSATAVLNTPLLLLLLLLLLC
jgi:hypothetical protein